VPVNFGRMRKKTPPRKKKKKKCASQFWKIAKADPSKKKKLQRLKKTLKQLGQEQIVLSSY